MITRLSIVILAAFSSVALSIAAQDLSGVSNNASQLTLFEAVETSSIETGQSSARPSRESRVTASVPEFVLIGTSRIGDRISATLRDRTGDSILVKGLELGVTAIEGHPGYSIVDVRSAAVSILFPSNTPCVEFTEKGVRCSSAANIANLSLANAEPVTAGAIQINDAGANDGADSVSIEATTNPNNPFELMRNAQREDAAEAANPAAARFTPRRINPEDVPEGKRVIATPFGDRLVDL